MKIGPYEYPRCLHSAERRTSGDLYEPIDTMIGRIDDLDNPEALTEVWRRAVPVVELSRMLDEHRGV
jgi:hypothetical protein